MLGHGQQLRCATLTEKEKTETAIPIHRTILAFLIF